MQILRSHSRSWELETQGWDPAICGLTSPSGDSDPWLMSENQSPNPSRMHWDIKAYNGPRPSAFCGQHLLYIFQTFFPWVNTWQILSHELLRITKCDVITSMLLIRNLWPRKVEWLSAGHTAHRSLELGLQPLPIWPQVYDCPTFASQIITEVLTSSAQRKVIVCGLAFFPHPYTFDWELGV